MDFKVSEDVHPITDFRHHPQEMWQRTRKSHRPLILTHRGRPAMVVEDAEAFEHRQERLELLEAVVQGLAEAERGELHPHQEVMAELQRRGNVKAR